jgi:hypothetical protein
MKVLLCACAAFAAGAVSADQPTSYMPVDIKEDFAATMKRMQAAKPAIEQRPRNFLRSHRISQADIDTVWTAIALHATPGIPQHVHPVVALVTAGVEMDVLGLTSATIAIDPSA